MQKLKMRFKYFLLKKRKGSTLVGVISVSILISIMSLGFFTVMSHMVDSEVRALNRAEAHYAAESGVILGIRFIRQLPRWPENNQDSKNIFLESEQINNFNVDVTYAADETGRVTIESAASSEEKTRGKTIRFDITLIDSSIKPFIINLQNYQESYTFNINN